MPYKKGELPHGGHGKDPRTLKEWVEAEPIVKEWLSKKRPGTARKYGEDFRAYWIDHLSRRYKSIEEWLDSVKKAQFQPDFEVQTAWAKDLESYITAKKISYKTRAKIAAAVMSFLEPRIGKHNARNYRFTFGSAEEIDSELRKSDTTTVSYDEVAVVLSIAKSTRDRALILVNLHGLGAAEICDFNENWYQLYDVLKSRTPELRWKSRVDPVRVNLIRKKKHVKFYTMFTDDCIDMLAMLPDEREKELGRPLKPTDMLFVNNREQPVTGQRIQEQLRINRLKAPVAHPENIKTHEIGRDCFVTAFANHHIGPFNDKGKSLPAEFCTGHTVDDFKYQKAAWTKKGEADLRDIFQQLRPELNLITARGRGGELVTAEAKTVGAIRDAMLIVLDNLRRGKIPSDEQIAMAKRLLGSQPELEDKTEGGSDDIVRATG